MSSVPLAPPVTPCICGATCAGSWELHLHMFSCRTKLAMLLCLKYLGSTSLAKRPWSNTWKLVPFCKGHKDKGQVRGASLTTRRAQKQSYSRGSLVPWIVTLKLRRVTTTLNDISAPFSSGTVSLCGCRFDLFLLFVTAKFRVLDVRKKPLTFVPE